MKIRIQAVLALLCCAGIACSSETGQEPVKPAHSIGGTASNVHGHGLLLKSANESLTLTADGAFSFRTKVMEGKPYSVGLANQPSQPKQDCTLTGGTGVMGTADVTNLQVACVTQQFTVGGLVTGLRGTVKLKLSDENQLTITENGEFDFPNAIDDYTAFEVTVEEHPAGQECVLSNSKGLLDGLDHTSLRVACVDTFDLGGVIRGATGPVQLAINGKSFTFDDNGAFTFPTPVRKGLNYTITVPLPPPDQNCAVRNGEGVMPNNDLANLVVTCARWYDFGESPEATFVFGQPDLESGESNAGGKLGAAGMNAPSGHVAATGEYFFVPDSENNRVLGFAKDPEAALGEATFVLGQPDLTSNDPATTKGGLTLPQSVTTDGTRLFVADTGNNRVLIYDAIPTADGAEPTVVVGQADFDSAAKDCNKSTLVNPTSAFVFGGKLIVADRDHHRVLIWNQLPTTDGQDADLVLGQSTFTSCKPNDINHNGTEHETPNGTTLFSPTDVWTDGEQLFVLDSGNHRVLIWNSFPTENAQEADLVLGQPDLETTGENTTAAGLSRPTFMEFTGVQLFVVDSGNHRVLVWNQPPTTSNQEADAVLGQPDFESALENNNGKGRSQVNGAGLSSPSGLVLFGSRLWLLDGGNHRLLGYETLSP